MTASASGVSSRCSIFWPRALKGSPVLLSAQELCWASTRTIAKISAGLIRGRGTKLVRTESGSEAVRRSPGPDKCRRDLLRDLKARLGAVIQKALVGRHLSVALVHLGSLRDVPSGIGSRQVLGLLGEHRQEDHGHEKKQRHAPQMCAPIGSCVAGYLESVWIQ